MKNSDGLGSTDSVYSRVELKFFGFAEEGALSEVRVPYLLSSLRAEYLGTVRERLSGSILNYILNYIQSSSS